MKNSDTSSSPQPAAGAKESRLRVLVVDDTILFRKIVSDVLTQVPWAEVVGQASNGKLALERIRALKPDVVTLDIEMPEMNGIEVLEAIRRERLPVQVIVVSAVTVRGGDLTMKALNLGAFDYITKPDGGGVAGSLGAIRESLVPLLRALAKRQEVRAILQGKPAMMASTVPAPEIAETYRRSSVCTIRPDVVCLGISTGGPNALTQMLPQIAAPLRVPLLIVQHMPPLFTKSLANSLNDRCKVPVKEAEHGESVQANQIYIAPGGRQMKVALGPDGVRKVIQLTDDPPENNCKPSADYLFRSVAQHYPGKATGVIMTGMGNDGTLGLKLLKRAGGFVIAQDEASCVVFGMPREAIIAGVVDVVTPLDRIADEIAKTVR